MSAEQSLEKNEFYIYFGEDNNCQRIEWCSPIFLESMTFEIFLGAKWGEVHCRIQKEI